MPYNPHGKAGTKQFTGIIRAQLKACNSKCQEITAYYNKLRARNPPVQMMTDAQAVTLANTAITCQTLLAMTN